MFFCYQRLEIPSFLGVHITVCAFLFSSVFIQLCFCQRFHLASFLGWTNVNAKPKRSKTSLLSKNVNGALKKLF